MRNPLSILGGLAVILWLACPILADWSPGMGHKMHEPQLPDEAGWDVMATYPFALADDWQCSESGPVKDIHFWGSWKHGTEGVINHFIVSIYSNLPEDPPSLPYSRPLELLWTKNITKFIAVPIDAATMEGWLDPTQEPILELYNDHMEYFQYNIFLPEEDWFFQTQGEIYWLSISAVLESGELAEWGWKSSIIHFMDNAVLGTAGDLCTAPDNGTGTVDLPADCPYAMPHDSMMIIDGLPPGTWIKIDPVLDNFGIIARAPGGSLGGETVYFHADLTMVITGRGLLTGFNRTIVIPVEVEIHYGPRTPGDPVQSFPAVIYSLYGEIMGDPDFAILSIMAGEGFGLPSPGITTLTQLPSGDWAVDSFFDITYQIGFEGQPGSILDGFSGSTTGTGRLEQGGLSSSWVELFEPIIPSTPIINPWDIAINPDGTFGGGGGGGAFGDGWYFYPNEQWWNIWFYDHPFSYYRYKEVIIQFEGYVIEPQMQSFVEIAVNWSTDIWSMEQPPLDSAPPLPGDEPEFAYIGRHTVYVSDFINGMFEFPVTIQGYNPEWISVDVRGVNFALSGTITHECIALEPEPLDLAFVITATEPNCCVEWGIPGDANKDTHVNLTDILDCISYVYVPPLGEPQAADGCNALYDVNGDGTSVDNPNINLTDILNMISNIYVVPLGEPVLCCPPGCIYP